MKEGGRAWSLSTAGKARKHLVRLMTRFERGEIEEGRFRALIYSFARLLEYFRFEKELELEDRISAIETEVGRSK